MARLHSPLLDNSTAGGGDICKPDGDFRPVDHSRKARLTISFILVILAVLVSWRWGYSYSWPAITGHVEQSFVGSSAGGEPYPIFANYAYSVSGVDYTGSRKLAVGHNQSDADALLKQYQFGTQLPVYYNPTNPADCIAERGEGWQAVLAMWLVVFTSLLPSWAAPVYRRGKDDIEETLPLLIKSRGCLSDAVLSEVESDSAHLPDRNRLNFLDRLRA